MSAYLNKQSKIVFNSSDTKNTSSNINQLIDILGIDVSSIDSSGTPQNTRKSYEIFMSGTNGDNTSVVKSSLYQTVYDQNFSFQSSNELLDITVGLCESSTEVTNTTTKTDSSGKLIFPDSTLMMREKINIYKQYAQYLLGSSSSHFYLPYESTSTNNRINAAVFINIKRLFSRDAIKKDTFAIKFNKSLNSNLTDNISTEGSNPLIYSDSGAITNHRVNIYSGDISTIKDSSNNDVGLIFYDRGIIVLDASKVFDYEVFDTTDIGINGNAITAGNVWKISDLGDTTAADWASLGVVGTPEKGSVFIANDVNSSGFGTGEVNEGKNLIDASSTGIDSVLKSNGKDTTFKHNLKNLFISGSIDDVVDHICNTRFTRNNETCLAFQNKTVINSTLLFCRVAPSQCNYSSNPTYIKSDGSFRVIDDENDEPFSYVTTIGLYNDSDELVAVAKTSRPIEKNPETDLSIRVRLDF